VYSPLGLALRTAVFGLIGFQLAQLAVAASLLLVWHSVGGEFASLLFIIPAGGAGFLAFYCMRETAAGLRAR